jgi:hypothetical protein
MDNMFRKLFEFAHCPQSDNLESLEHPSQKINYNANLYSSDLAPDDHRMENDDFSMTDNQIISPC